MDLNLELARGVDIAMQCNGLETITWRWRGRDSFEAILSLPTNRNRARTEPNLQGKRRSLINVYNSDIRLKKQKKNYTCLWAWPAVCLLDTIHQLGVFNWAYDLNPGLMDC